MNAMTPLLANQIKDTDRKVSKRFPSPVKVVISSKFDCSPPVDLSESAAVKNVPEESLILRDMNNTSVSIQDDVD